LSAAAKDAGFLCVRNPTEDGGTRLGNDEPIDDQRVIKSSAKHVANLIAVARESLIHSHAQDRASLDCDHLWFWRRGGLH
jgi:hypothetical protein